MYTCKKCGGSILASELVFPTKNISEPYHRFCSNYRSPNETTQAGTRPVPTKG